VRQHHYTFAHRVLRDAVLEDPDIAKRELAGKGAAKWLRGLWDTAGEESESDEAPSVLQVFKTGIRGYDAYRVTFPPALHVTEAWGALIAFPHNASEEPCYFLLERGADADDTGHWARYRPGGMRIRGEYVPGTDPALLNFAFEVEMKVPPEWKVEAERKDKEREKRGPRPLPDRYDIPGWWDKDLLARIVQGYRSNTFTVVLAFFALTGSIVPAGLGALTSAKPIEKCVQAQSEGLSPYKVCRNLRSPKSYGYDKKKERKRCKRETKGRSLVDYCVERSRKSLPWFGLAGALLGAGLFFVLLAVYFKRHVPKFVKILRDRPEDVVWVYLYTLRRRGGGTVLEEVHLGLRNGIKCKIEVPGSAQDAVRCIAGLTRGATLGYTEANQKQFFRDPGSMRQ
jgi:hypothetical protein